MLTGYHYFNTIISWELSIQDVGKHERANMISLQKISKQFGGNVLFKDVDLQVSLNDRVGLIGWNGSGKTTLFSLILGDQTPDSGQIERNKSMSIGCLEQEVVKDLSIPLIKEVGDSCPHLSRMKEKIDLLHEEIACEKDPAKIQLYIQRLGEFQTEFESCGGYSLEYQAKRILFGLGFKESDLNRCMREFSGGWRTRACLSKLLLREPDLLLLDEPTNHLDLESVVWLEQFLKEYRGAVMVISHDRTFLNKIVTRIIEIDQKTLHYYSGNYDSYVEQKQTRQENLEAAFKNQQKRIMTTERFIEKFRYKATKARQVQSRVKSLEKIERIHLDRSSPQFTISIPSPSRAGKIILQLKDISKRYGDKVVYERLTLTVHRGDRVALVGPNGSGKSTLLKIMAGSLAVDAGEVGLGYNLVRAYFAQHQLEILQSECTVMEEIVSCLGADSEIKARSYLGSFLFRGDDVFKKVSVLSGGEKSRLVLAKMILKAPNFLLLDEPTNHLDIPSRDCLQEALRQYSGTICMISHDRAFINRLANKIFRIENGQVEIFSGNYDDYLNQINQRKEREDISAVESPGREIKLKSREQKRLEAERRNQRYRRLNPLKRESEQVQAELHSVLEAIDHLKRLFADPVYYQKPEFSERLREYRELEMKSEELTDRWTELEEQIEAVEGELRENPAEGEI